MHASLKPPCLPFPGLPIPQPLQVTFFKNALKNCDSFANSISVFSPNSTDTQDTNNLIFRITYSCPFGKSKC